MNRDGRCGGAATVRWAAYGGESADGVPAQMVVVVSSSTLFRREGVVPQCSTCDVHVQCNVCIRGLEGGGGAKNGCCGEDDDDVRQNRSTWLQ
jgi:hypothetical protein